MPLHRAIFRIDFPMNCKFINEQGTVLQFLNDAGSEIFPELGDTPQNRRIQGILNENTYSHAFNAEPTTINWTIESATGISLNSIDSHKWFIELSNLVDKICKHFEITELQRCGIRFIYFGMENSPGDQVLKKFRDSHEKKLISFVEENLGVTTDYMMNFDGVCDDMLSYHMKIGPYLGKEPDRVLRTFTKESIEPEYKICFDLDIYEQDFKLPYGNSRRWAKAAIKKALDLENSAITYFEDIERD